MLEDYLEHVMDLCDQLVTVVEQRAQNNEIGHAARIELLERVHAVNNALVDLRVETKGLERISCAVRPHVQKTWKTQSAR